MDNQTDNSVANAVARVLEINRQIAESKRKHKMEIDALAAEKWQIVTAQGQLVAKHQIGHEVNVPYGYGRNKKTRRYRITRIGGSFWSPRQVLNDAQLGDDPSVSEGEFTTEYYGRHVKADGTLSEKEKRLYEGEFQPTRT